MAGHKASPGRHLRGSCLAARGGDDQSCPSLIQAHSFIHSFMQLGNTSGRVGRTRRGQEWGKCWKPQSWHFAALWRTLRSDGGKNERGQQAALK